ncbi:arginyltransferase [Thalassospiraceae bacterium LMO-SO8]|nr:arginyltransferase [Alphaproteobacteria bacterium LMO-S08]WND75675.1 arginyltransferase [Thalassospiraceae bacterium LMO-SO8]
MRHKPISDTRFFFATAPLPCPYLPDRVERRVVTELFGRDATRLHDQLSYAGFRRSHGIVYAPACPGCDACKAVRIAVDGFDLRPSMKRILKANTDLSARMAQPAASQEQYRLFQRYQASRHSGGDMSKMDYLDYQALIEDTPIDTGLITYRDGDGTLTGAMLADRLGDGLSAVYSYFDPEQPRRGMGTYMILWLIDEAKRLGLPYVYLGFWIEGCNKMSYKARFRPLEVHTAAGWRNFDDFMAKSDG